jgi:MoaA/NifB/PqqE/SkfB family radical SAM enzyme
MAPLDHVYFELTNACNFRCDFCPLADSGRPVRSMDMALFRKGIDEIVEGRLACSVGFHVLGEPLLSPSLIPAVRYARERGLRTQVTTNGSLLPGRWRRVVEAAPAQVTVSLQSTDAADHRSRGTRIPFEAYYRGVMEGVGRLRSALPDAEIVVCVMNTGSRRLFRFDRAIRIDAAGRTYERHLVRTVLDVAAAAGLDVDEERLLALLERTSLGQPRTLRLDPRLAVQVLMLGDWGNAFTSAAVHPPPIAYCGYALRRVGVLSTGEVTMCCVDTEGRTALGNLRTDSLADLLDSPRARAARQGFRRLRAVDAQCRRCLGGETRLHALVKGLGSLYLFAFAHPLRSPEVSLSAAIHRRARVEVA